MSLVVPQSILPFLRFVVVSLSVSPLAGCDADVRCWIAVVVRGGACSAFSLTENQIGDVGAEAFARAVHVNTSLKKLV